MPDLGVDVGEAVRPMSGELRSADFVIVASSPEHHTIGVIDMAGHGALAHQDGRPVAAELGALAGDPHRDVTSLLEAAHDSLLNSRGAAVGVATVRGDRVEFAGVGNVRCVHFAPGGGGSTRLPSRDGLVGVRFRTPAKHLERLEPGGVLILHSDGVVSDARWELSEVHAGTAASIAGAVVGRYGRDTDDASCVVVRRRRPDGGQV